MSTLEIWTACLLWAFAGYMWGRHRNAMFIEHLRMEIAKLETVNKMLMSNPLTPEGMALIDEIVKDRSRAGTL